MMRTNCLGSLQAALKDAGLEDRCSDIPAGIMAERLRPRPQARPQPTDLSKLMALARSATPPNRHLIGEPLGAAARLRSRIGPIARRRRRRLVRQGAKRDGLSLHRADRGGGVDGGIIASRLFNLLRLQR